MKFYIKRSSYSVIFIMLTVNKNIKKNVIMTGRSCKGASYWLTTPPNARNNTTIESSSFRALIKYSIGLPQFSGTHKCPDCGKEQDKFGHHALSCRFNRQTQFNCQWHLQTAKTSVYHLLLRSF